MAVLYLLALSCGFCFAKNLYNKDLPHIPKACATCPINTDGKVHGVRGVKNVPRKDAKGNCSICDVAKTCQERILSLSDPKSNPNLIPVDGYKETIFVHKGKDVSNYDSNLSHAKDIIDNNFGHIKCIIINHHIIENGLPNQEYTFYYKDGTKLYGDRKGILGETGITTSFSTAVNEKCDKVIVIEFDTQKDKIIHRLKIDKMASKLLGRMSDFESGAIRECYLIRDGYAVMIDKKLMTSGNRAEVKKKLINMLAPMREKKEG